MKIKYEKNKTEAQVHYGEGGKFRDILDFWTIFKRTVKERKM